MQNGFGCVRAGCRDLVHALGRCCNVGGPPSAVRMDRHGVGKLETGILREFTDRKYGNVTDGYLDDAGGMVQSMAVEHFS